MLVPLLAPDTSAILAYGFGPDADPRASWVAEAVESFRKTESKMMLLHTVKVEYERKLETLSNVELVLKEFYHTSADSGRDQAAVPALLSLEEAFVAIRTKFMGKDMERYIGAVERVLATLMEQQKPLGSFPLAAAAILQVEAIKAGIETRIRALGAVDCPPPRSPVASKGIPRARGDEPHVGACEVMGRELKRGVVFMFLDGKLYTAKKDLETAYPHVRCCGPTYVRAYLSQDSSTWGMGTPPTS